MEEKLSDYATARAVVLPIPYEATVSYGGGTRLGPQAIIAASRQVETYDAEFDREPCSIGIATLGELEQDAGGPAAMNTKIENAAEGILSDGKFLLTLGGEHSITYPLVRAHKKRYPGVSVLQIDAHTDLRDEYQGTPLSHACVMSRVSELCDVVQVGIRSFCGSTNERKTRDAARVITSAEFRKNPDSVSKILSMLTDNVYITFDLDAFDPSLMPAVGTPEPGGLLWDETMELIKAIGKSKHIVGADVVELAPIPGLYHPDFTAARLAYKIIGWAFNERD